mmetsp:Transcript_13194/g.30780  ORF Transcript_13194/g.30780 Transcript_13194/m.30780 type:complete len:408 (+) Transcript_13194:132-1355(+)
MKTKQCMNCERELGKDSYSNRGWKRKSVKCKECYTLSQNDGRPRKKFKPSVLDNSKRLQATKKGTQKKRSVTNDDATGRKQEPLDQEQIKSKLKERIQSIPPPQKKNIRIIWFSKSTSTTDEKKVADKLVLKGCYGPIDRQQMASIKNHIQSTEISLFQAITIRAAYLKQKTMFRTAMLRKQSRDVCNQYKNGCSVLDLAQKFDQPPMNVFRTILSELKWSKGAIKIALRDPKKFKARERKEFLAAESADIVSMVNQADIHENAEEFEDVLSVWLEEKGIRFVRQKELESEQKDEFGKAIVTPDFLILDQLEINGVACHWIDCKAYYGTNQRLSIRKTKQQMSRYIDHWGSGAIVYLQGFSEAMEIMEDCIVLSAHGALDKKTLSRLEEEHCVAINNVSKTVFEEDK